MLITLSIPDNTTAILYCTQYADEQGCATETIPRKITFDMLTKVEQE